MSIDLSKVQWDSEPPIDLSSVKWDEPAKTSEGMPSTRRFDFATATPEERKAYSRQQLATGPQWP
ncbi:MAG: hypothetical protein ACO3E4_07645, partial [Candidatus Nanopelagicaceae bacterium]